MLVFPSPVGALRCAIEVQRAFEERAAERPDERIRVRMGLHTGEAIAEEGDFFGRNVILAARIAAQARGGEILVSEALHEQCRGRRRARLRRAPASSSSRAWPAPTPCSGPSGSATSPRSAASERLDIPTRPLWRGGADSLRRPGARLGRLSTSRRLPRASPGGWRRAPARHARRRPSPDRARPACEASPWPAGGSRRRPGGGRSPHTGGSGRNLTESTK